MKINILQLFVALRYSFVMLSGKSKAKFNGSHEFVFSRRHVTSVHFMLYPRNLQVYRVGRKYFQYMTQMTSKTNFCYYIDQSSNCTKSHDMQRLYWSWENSLRNISLHQYNYVLFQNNKD